MRHSVIDIILHFYNSCISLFYNRTFISNLFVKELSKFCFCKLTKGIADEEKRAKYRQKFISNETFRNQELEYILLLTDRYISFDKPQMLAKLYLSYLDDEIIWQEFTMYAEVVDRFLMLDCNTLTGDAEKIIVPRNIGGESVLRLVALGLMTEITETSAFVRGNNGNIGLSMEGLKKATSRNRTYKRTEFGEKLANILR